MDLHLYNYDGENNVINKFATDIQLIKSLDVELRMPFNPLSPTFTISEYHKCNYCHFYYHDTFYACYCDITTLSDGLYQINCYIDSLTTAYQNGAMLGVQCKMLYSAQGDAFLPDPRIVVNRKKRTETYRTQFDKPTNNSNSTYLLLTYGKRNAAESIVPSSIHAYVIQSATTPLIAITNKLLEMEEETTGAMARLSSSILGFYTLNYIGDLDSIIGLYANNDIILTELIDPVVGGTTIDEVKVSLTGDVREYKSSVPMSIKKTLTINETITPYDPPIKMTIEGIGDFYIDVRDYNTNIIETIGVRIYFDCIGASYIAFPIINGIEDRRHYIIAPITTSNPIMSSSSASDSRLARLTGITSAVNGVASSIMTGNIGGLLTTGVSAVSNAISPTLTPPTGGVIRGNVGGDPTQASEFGLTVIVEHSDIKTNPDGFKSLFGAPDGELRFISNMQGYFIADDVHLNINGLPVAIVNDAESQLKTGVYMV